MLHAGRRLASSVSIQHLLLAQQCGEEEFLLQASKTRAKYTKYIPVS
jgi:hypothetical protein